MTSILICGAYDHTGNLGVSALGNAFAAAWKAVRPQDDIYLQALDGMIRPVEFHGLDAAKVHLLSVSLRPSKRIYKLDTIWGMTWSRYLPIKNPYREILDKIDIFFDVAGGDSFTDLYGELRFNIINAIKDEAISRNKPLILLPQTYGPFKSEESRARASRYASYASYCVARDLNSYEILKEILGDNFDPEKHLSGVDMAFLLPLAEATDKIEKEILEWISSGKKFIGINISGLIYNQPDKAVAQYSFKANYNEAVLDFINWVLENTSLNIAIIPHVLVPEISVESDLNASRALVNLIPEIHTDRVCVQTYPMDQCEVKYLISKCDWFMGTRMHATIAGLSTGVPTATISYSDKALGVFQTCESQHAVLDPRKLDNNEIEKRLIELLTERENHRSILEDCIPKVKQEALNQVREIADYCSEI